MTNRIATTNHRRLALLPAALAFGLALAQGACSDDDAAGPTGKEVGPPAAPGTSQDASPPRQPTADGAPDAPIASPTAATIAAFDASKFELAEGLALHDGNAYVSLAPLGTIVKVTPAGVVSTYASVPPGYNDGYTLGLAFDAQGALFATQTKNAPLATVTPGIYKIPAGGSATQVTTPFATDDAMTFPNGIAIGDQGDLLVTDSGSGIVFKVTSAGVVTRWKEGIELEGSPACPGPLPFPIGANGIVRTASDVFVTNTAKGSVVRIAIAADGSAGALTPVVADCKYLGLDGVARDADGSLVVAQNGSPGRVLRITTTGTAPGTVSVLHDGAPLDGPGSVAIASAWKGRRAALVTSTAFFSVGVDGGAPKPALLELAPLP